MKKIILSSSILFLITSCNNGSSKNSLTENVKDTVLSPGAVISSPVVYAATKESDIKRECSVTEVSQIKICEQKIQASNTKIDQAKALKDESVIAISIDAQKSCDQVITNLNNLGTCKISGKATILGTSISYYDQYRLSQKFSKTENYLFKNNARPGNSTASATEPVVVNNPVSESTPLAPLPPVPSDTAPEIVSGSVRQCSSAEFSNLSNMVTSLNLSIKQIDSLGSDWKYDSNAISNSAVAAKSCESLILYHDQNPCEKSILQTDGTKSVKQYTGLLLRQRCQKTRTYFYEYVQNKSTLNFSNADLYLDISSFDNKLFEADYVNEIQGCRIENKSAQAIDYSGSNLIQIKSSRGFESKMMVLESTEGLLIQCYGLNIDGPFSKRELVKALQDEGTDMPLVYKLK